MTNELNLAETLIIVAAAAICLLTIFFPTIMGIVKILRAEDKKTTEISSEEAPGHEILDINRF